VKICNEANNKICFISNKTIAQAISTHNSRPWTQSYVGLFQGSRDIIPKASKMKRPSQQALFLQPALDFICYPLLLLLLLLLLLMLLWWWWCIKCGFIYNGFM